MKATSNNILWTATLFLLLFSVYPIVAYSQETMDELAAMSKSSSYIKRLQASLRILNASDFDTAKAVSIIINGIKAEIEDPPILTEKEDGLLVRDNFDSMLEQYIIDLSKLGESVLPLLCPYEDSSRSIMKDWIILARGFMEDTLVHDKIVDLYYENTSMVIRAAAVGAIGRYKNKSDLKLLQDALLDTSYIQVGSDVYDLHGRNMCGDKMYLVRYAANRALYNMGYITESDTLDNFKIIKEPDTLQVK
jgi:hypothetical protein